jgi:hypothetical protein
MCMSVQYCQTGMRAERNVSVNRFLRNSVDLHGASATPMRVVCACRSEKPQPFAAPVSVYSVYRRGTAFYGCLPPSRMGR